MQRLLIFFLFCLITGGFGLFGWLENVSKQANKRGLAFKADPSHIEARHPHTEWVQHTTRDGQSIYIPLEGSICFNLTSGFFTQEGEICAVGPGLCNPFSEGGDGKGCFEWDILANKFWIKSFNVVTPEPWNLTRDASIGDWHSANTDTNRKPQQYTNIDTYAQCLVTKIGIDSDIAKIYYNTHSGKVMGEEDAFNRFITRSGFAIEKEVPTVRVWEGQPKRRAGTYTDFVDELKFFRILEPVTGSAGGWATFPPDNICLQNATNIKPMPVYVPKWGLQPRQALTGYDVIANTFSQGSAMVLITDTAGPNGINYNFRKENTHDFVVGPSGGVGAAFDPLYDIDDPEAYLANFGLDCDEPFVVTPNYPFGPQFSPAFIYRARAVCYDDETLDILDADAGVCECVDSNGNRRAVTKGIDE